MEHLPTFARRHDLDALRGFAMLLGIALHAGLAYSGGPWMVQDPQRSGVFLVFIGVVHGFRMPLFFVLSGFFTAMLWRRRGLRAVMGHRFKRVFLPLVLGTLTIMPVMFWLGAVAAKSGEAKASKGPPTVWEACAKGDLGLVRKLLEEGAEVNAPDPAFGVTPLSYAALFGRDEIARLLLLERGADPNRTNRDGGTALHGAAFLGRGGIAAELLKAGADATIQNDRGETALEATGVDWGTTEFILKLLKVKVEKEAVLKGRQEVRRMLGGGSEEEAAPRPWLGLWLFATQMPIFGHLWFLWFLCWMVAGFAVWAWMANRLGWKPQARRWVTSPLRYLWLVPLTMIPAWFMSGAVGNFGPDTSSSLLPPLHLLAYYAVFFGYGVLYFDSEVDGQERAGEPQGEVEGGDVGVKGEGGQGVGERERERGESCPGKKGWLTLLLPLAVALLVVYPAGLAATIRGGEKLRGAAVLLQVLYVWMMSAAMMGLFRRLVSQERAWIRYLSDASYWMYLAHLPLVMAAQLWVRDWALPAGLKFLVVCGGVFAVLLVSYEYLVRYTWVGAVLNGRKGRGIGEFKV